MCIWVAAGRFAAARAARRCGAAVEPVRSGMAAECSPDTAAQQGSVADEAPWLDVALQWLAATSQRSAAALSAGEASQHGTASRCGTVSQRDAAALPALLSHASGATPLPPAASPSALSLCMPEWAEPAASPPPSSDSSFNCLSKSKSSL